MYKQQENKMNMYKVIYTLLSNNKSKLQTIIAFQNTYNDFEKKINEINQKDRKRATVAKGKTLAKLAAKKKLIDKTMEVAALLHAWASEKGHDDIVAITVTRRSYLGRTRDGELSNIVEAIYQIAEQQVSQLEDYGITSERVLDFKKTIAFYNKALGGQASSIAQRISARESLSVLFSEADKILKHRLDNFMELFRNSDGDFYNSYRSARSIKDK